MKEKLYSLIANQVRCYHSAVNEEWRRKHEYALESLMKHMPSGSGIDAGTKLLLSESNENKLVFKVEYHHMNGGGYYCGWTTRNIIITPSLINGYNMEFEFISNDADFTEIVVDEETGEELEEDNSEFAIESTDDYLADTFRYALEQEYELTLADYEPTKLTWHGELVLTN